MDYGWNISLFSLLVMFFALGMGAMMVQNSLEHRDFSELGRSLFQPRVLRSLDWMSGIIGLKDHLI